MSEKYNGWTNYETWLANLWMDNDEGSYNHWQSEAQECYDDSESGGLVASFSREDNAAGELRERLKSFFDDEAVDNGLMPDLGACLYSDLLNGRFPKSTGMRSRNT